MPSSILQEVFPVQVPFADGYLLPPTAPGLGVEFDEDAAKEFPCQPGNSPLLHRADGSFTNW